MWEDIKDIILDGELAIMPCVIPIILYREIGGKILDYFDNWLGLIFMLLYALIFITPVCFLSCVLIVITPLIWIVLYFANKHE